eukprot:CAMPEP_0174824782 /NCGR_PEP_ID=MMETSP1107-20130205/38037_1 /TAXON_ID=36770 /ORGANISM="Paraphysomonas vestita, Strain GFlagA" /LENGTH=308 /DNA_ID=CAMNT_0016053973 /DNA_START=569 /DNA_END=1495 /DNA_ORIENTATION=+
MMKSSSTSNSDIELLQLRGKCLYAMGDVENSVKHYQQALRCDPDNTLVRTEYKQIKDINDTKERGNTAYKEGRYEDAINEWERCIQLDRNNRQFISKIYSNKANAYAKLRKHEDAVRECNLSLRANSDNLKALLRRAESNYAIGTEQSLQEALKDYEALHERNESEVGDMSKKIKQTKTAIKMAGRKDLYKILEVGRDADPDDIRKAYRKLALKYHPDKQAGKSEAEIETASTKFKAVSEAYEILSDPEKKSKYDSGVDIEDLDNPHAGHGGGGGFGGHGGHSGIDPNILFQMFMQQQGGGHGGMRFG